NQLHDPNQSGYKPAHSTETALIAVWVLLALFEDGFSPIRRDGPIR
ncbi:hypothetical protein P4O66_007592, partial [Electrophorus voltai]